MTACHAARAPPRPVPPATPSNRPEPTPSRDRGASGPAPGGGHGNAAPGGVPGAAEGRERRGAELPGDGLVAAAAGVGVVDRDVEVLDLENRLVMALLAEPVGLRVLHGVVD